jgi:hypothetical protein
MENYTDKFAKRVNDLVEQSKEPIKTVECIYKWNNITLGKKYPVISNYKSYYLILDDAGKQRDYHRDFFKDIEEPIKQQKRVECIENHYQNIEIGDELFVVEESEDKYLVTFPSGNDVWVLKFRFKVLEPKAVLKRVKFRYAKEISTYSDVTFENTYDVVKITVLHYTIVNNEGKEDVFHKDYFRKNKKAKKKEKKIKALRTVLSVSSSVIAFSKFTMLMTGLIPHRFSTYEDLVKVASEEINKDNPNMERMNFLMGLIKELTEKTTNK